MPLHKEVVCVMLDVPCSCAESVGLRSDKQVDPGTDLQKGKGERREGEGTKHIRKYMRTVGKT